MADKNPLSPEEVTELFSEIDASGVLDPTLAKKRRERMRAMADAEARGDLLELGRLSADERASHAAAVDPLSDADPSGSKVGTTITRTAIGVVLVILLLIVGMQIGYGAVSYTHLTLPTKRIV